MKKQKTKTVPEMVDLLKDPDQIMIEYVKIEEIMKTTGKNSDQKLNLTMQDLVYYTNAILNDYRFGKYKKIEIQQIRDHKLKSEIKKLKSEINPKMKMSKKDLGLNKSNKK
jgi:hypothetical protein|tara:strand:- start:10775 stop:11107 length:333 start_codon:yes stop_codon:yes gene_type:complete